MKTQTLHVMAAGDCWVVEWANTEKAPLIERLFGTTLVPTPFLRVVNGQHVANHIARLNPEYVVALRDGGASCQ